MPTSDAAGHLQLLRMVTTTPPLTLGLSPPFLHQPETLSPKWLLTVNRRRRRLSATTSSAVLSSASLIAPPYPPSVLVFLLLYDLCSSSETCVATNSDGPLAIVYPFVISPCDGIPACLRQRHQQFGAVQSPFGRLCILLGRREMGDLRGQWWTSRACS